MRLPKKAEQLIADGSGCQELEDRTHGGGRWRGFGGAPLEAGPRVLGDQLNRGYVPLDTCNSEECAKEVEAHNCTMLSL